MDKNYKCENKEHLEIIANCFCSECNKYMCNKCEVFHSKLFGNHITLNLDKKYSDTFTGFCKEEKHKMELEYFCRTHNVLCCAACIAKIAKNGNGIHKDCEVCIIEDIKEEKKIKLKENIKYLEELSKTIEDPINNIKIIIDKISKNKEELKIKIQKIFTKIRNEINNREDELLIEVDKKYENIFFKEEFVKENEKLPEKIKKSLEKSQIIDKEYNEKKLQFLIN